MAFEDIEEKLNNNKYIDNKDIKRMLEVAQKATKQGITGKVGEWRVNSKTLQKEWVALTGDIDDIQYRFGMGHILSKDEVRFVLRTAQEFKSQYGNEPNTPVINPPTPRYTITFPTTSTGTTWGASTNVTGVSPMGTTVYFPCAICGNAIDGMNSHKTCVDLLDATP